LASAFYASRRKRRKKVDNSTRFDTGAVAPPNLSGVVDYSPKVIALPRACSQYLQGDAYRRTVLEPGGSKPAAKLVEDFLGRPYSFKPYEAWLNGN
jgi:hypothetical protein